MINCRPPRTGEDWSVVEWKVVDKLVQAMRGLKRGAGVLEVRRTEEGRVTIYQVKRFEECQIVDERRDGYR